MNAVLKPQHAIDIARQIATSIEHSNEDSYKAIALALLIAAESDADLLGELAQYGANALANNVLSEMRQRRDEAARVEARRKAIERIRPKNAYQVQAQENRRQQLKAVAETITFNWLTTYTLAGVKLGSCRQYEIDRAATLCEKQSTAYQTKLAFLRELRGKLKDHKQRVSEVLTHKQIASIAKAVGYTREV